MNNKQFTLILSLSVFVVGFTAGVFFSKFILFSASKIESLAEQRALEKIELLRKATDKRIAILRDSLLRQEKDKLVFDYKRVITSDDVKITKRVDEILDSLYNAVGLDK
jgi:hypothetical protein